MVMFASFSLPPQRLGQRTPRGIQTRDRASWVAASVEAGCGGGKGGEREEGVTGTADMVQMLVTDVF